MKSKLLNITVRLAIFLLTSAAALSSCKKDESDPTPPEVNIYSPAENTVYNVFDTITTTFSVKDDLKLTSITLSLVDASLQPVLPPIGVGVQSNFQTNTMSIVINDIHLVSGNYFIKVTATDGDNSVYKLRQVYINEAPTTFKTACFISQPGPNQVQLYKLDSLQNIVLVAAMNGDFAAGATSSWYQYYFSAASASGNLNAIDLVTNSVRWTVPITSGPYMDVHVSGKNTYLAAYDGRIKGYNIAGQSIYTAQTGTGFYPTKVYRHNDYIVVGTKEIISPTRKLVLFDATSGIGAQECLMVQDPVAIISKDVDNIFVIGNNSGQAVIEIYQVSTNGFWSPTTLPAGTVLDAVQVDADNYLISHSNGTIYHYKYSLNSMTTVTSGTVASKIQFDAVNQMIWAAEGMNLKKFSYPLGTPSGTIAHSQTIVDLDILFNK
jgi:hypothetical protein